MRSAKSFFNGAIARSDLRRYWPVLFLYVGLWLIFLLGIPAQLAAVLSFGFRLPTKKPKAPEKAKDEKPEDKPAG